MIVGDKDERQFLQFQGGSTGICTILGGDNRKKEYYVDLVINETVLAILQKTKKIRISIGIHGEKMDDYIFPVSFEL